MSTQIETLTNAVQRNCDISDAAYAGIFSVCTLGLLLRGLFKWENGLAPWEERESSETLAWIGEREDRWDAFTETDFLPVPINGKHFDAFDTTAINEELATHRLFYGAGYAHGLKPTFFLAERGISETIHGVQLHRIGRELARDLLILPALTQDNQILFREQCARAFLWDQILYIRKSGRKALDFALRASGIKDSQPAAIKAGFEMLFNAQVTGYIYHELGEIIDTGFDRSVWREILSQFPHTPLELIARVVKDVLADTNPFGTLPLLIAERNSVAIGFYSAFRGSMTRKLFPDFENRFQEFIEENDWGQLSAAVADMRETAGEYARFITETYLDGQNKHDPARAQRVIESRFFTA